MVSKVRQLINTGLEEKYVATWKWYAPKKTEIIYFCPISLFFKFNKFKNLASSLWWPVSRWFLMIPTSPPGLQCCIVPSTLHEG